MEDVEWIPTQVLGQSFLLHQIHKMISVAIDVARGAAPLVFMEKALSKEEIVINVAPAQGLFLEMSNFGGYNRQKSQNKELSNLDWNVEGLAHTHWKEFRDIARHHIVQEEIDQGNFVQYIYYQEYIYSQQRMYGLKQNGTTKKKKDSADADETTNKRLRYIVFSINTIIYSKFDGTQARASSFGHSTLVASSTGIPALLMLLCFGVS
jgi:hypothetical protein